MRKKGLLAAIVAGVLVIVFISEGLFIVKETEQGIILQFGEVRGVVKDPGLQVKLPFVQNVIYYDDRILDVSPDSFEVLLTDKKRIIIDGFALYKINDPVKFYERVKTENRLADLFGKSLNAASRRILATVSIADILSKERDGIMSQIREQVENQAVSLGIEIIDIRIGRTEFPPQTSQAVYNRMRTERERLARESRAQGEAIARKLRADADKTSTVILAEAKRDSDILRGQGEGGRNTILGKAYNSDPKFFEFYKSLEAYKQSLESGTMFVLGADSEFFKYFGDSLNTREESADK